MNRRFRLLTTGLLGLAVGCSKSSQETQEATPAPSRVLNAVTAAKASSETKAKPAEKTTSTPKTEPPKSTNSSPTPFAFPDDAAGQLLAKQLPPTDPGLGGSGQRSAQQARELPGALASPAAPLPRPTDAMPRLPLPAAGQARLTPLPDSVPLELAPVQPNLPERSSLPAGPLTKQPGPDMARPVDVPILSAKPVSDRAPLTDPTMPFTAASVISAVLPLRTEVLGFFRINLPDPFENSSSAKPITPPNDDPNRSLPNVPIQR